ncbi:peptidase M8 [Heterostelium album PN500]|uniref:Peptidase M8 n=1 Tax=Heterostelium pallidum (strain ATCC 26659 / Pp 5 / PN500) TaxID=670386 RepID=D3BLF4_HETP5|nr:peptidase M8 [Heterostelium album PN500]EFA77888.1 peptidase M8 [Heterostelium album PN500]|eukprot:XP_020430016.1 peptidase M8 [Heterostelium album PN500]
MEKIGRVMNLRGHLSGINPKFLYGPGNLEIHRSLKNKRDYFAIDFARLLPPQAYFDEYNYRNLCLPCSSRDSNTLLKVFLHPLNILSEYETLILKKSKALERTVFTTLSCLAMISGLILEHEDVICSIVSLAVLQSEHLVFSILHAILLSRNTKRMNLSLVVGLSSASLTFSTTHHHHKNKIESENDRFDVFVNNLVRSNSNNNNNRRFNSLKQAALKGVIKNDGSPSTTHPIRIVFNTTYLDPANKHKLSCFSANQTYITPAGNYSAVTDCRNSTTDCVYTCKASDVLSVQLYNFIIAEMLSHVSSTFAKFLTVYGPDYYYYDNEPFVCEQEEYLLDLRSGFAGDIMIYVTAHPSTFPFIGYSSNCVEHADGKPFISIINFNPSELSPFLDPVYKRNNAAKWDSLVLGLAEHEVIHSLGFASYFYPNFTDRATGKPYTYPIYEEVNATGITPSGQPFTVRKYYIKLPSVIQVARNHFNCNTLDRVELENNGEEGTYASHWKTTLFSSEIMNGFYNPHLTLTNFTLALLYDSGWYGLINLDKVGNNNWGKGKGCDFVNKPCSPSTWNFTGYWQNPNSTGCSATRVGIGKAELLIRSQPLPPQWQHWVDPTYGGRSDRLDYCLYNFPSDLCQDPSKSLTYEGEIRGPDSYCFNHVSKSNDSVSFGCRRQRCNNNNQLEVEFLGSWYQCLPGMNLTLSNSTIIICPDKDDQTCRLSNFDYNPSTSPFIKPDDDESGSTSTIVTIQFYFKLLISQYNMSVIDNGLTR